MLKVIKVIKISDSQWPIVTKHVFNIWMKKEECIFGTRHKEEPRGVLSVCVYMCGYQCETQYFWPHPQWASPDEITLWALLYLLNGWSHPCDTLPQPLSPRYPPPVTQPPNCAPGYRFATAVWHTVRASGKWRGWSPNWISLKLWSILLIDGLPSILLASTLGGGSLGAVTTR